MASLIRVSIQGALPGGEVWSVNPVFAPTVPLSVSTDECLAIATAIDAVAVPAGVTAVMNGTTTVTGCRVEARNVDGTLEAVAEHLKTTPVAGTGATSHPYQTSLVLSLRTADSTARGKGRLYWPATGAQISATTLRMATAAQQAFVDGLNTYLGGIRTAIRANAGLTTATLVVWSRASSSTRVVLTLRAGDVLDTQRRRRDTLVESYLTATVAP